MSKTEKSETARVLLDDMWERQMDRMRQQLLYGASPLMSPMAVAGMASTVPSIATATNAGALAGSNAPPTLDQDPADWLSTRVSEDIQRIYAGQVRPLGCAAKQASPGATGDAVYSLAIGGAPSFLSNSLAVSAWDDGAASGRLNEQARIINLLQSLKPSPSSQSSTAGRAEMRMWERMVSAITEPATVKEGCVGLGRTA